MCSIYVIEYHNVFTSENGSHGETTKASYESFFIESGNQKFGRKAV